MSDPWLAWFLISWAGRGRTRVEGANVATTGFNCPYVGWRLVCRAFSRYGVVFPVVKAFYSDIVNQHFHFVGGLRPSVWWIAGRQPLLAKPF